jgi:hypothetical protein
MLRILDEGQLIEMCLRGESLCLVKGVTGVLCGARANCATLSNLIKK